MLMMISWSNPAIGSKMGKEGNAWAGIEPCDAHRFLCFEVVAGTAVARIAAGEELVILRRKAL